MQEIIQKIKELETRWRALQPMKAEFQKKFDQKMRLEFNYNSNHIEGNTLTYGETELLLIFDDTKGNHTYREYEEMKAHDVAYYLIKDWAKEPERPLTEQQIKNLNEIILVRPFWKEAITPDGQPTRRQIKIGDYKELPNSVRLQNGEIFEYASPTDTPIRMGELVQWYRTESGKGEKHPIELAALLHYEFVRIHPFDDGNGRLSRLLMNYVLLKNDLPPIVVKSADKRNYLAALHSADIGDLAAFVGYIANQLVWSLEIGIKAAKGESIEEPDDLDKEISLLKKNLSFKPDEVVKSEEILAELWNHSLKNLYRGFIDLSKKFTDLFDSHTLLISTKIGNQGVGWSNESELDNFFNSKPEKMKMVFLSMSATYTNMKRLGHSANMNIAIGFTDIEYELVNHAIGFKEKYQYGKYIEKSTIEFLLSETGKALLKDINQKIHQS